MGTNYYIRDGDVCPHCSRQSEDTHIGKSSSGWKFVFNATERKTKAEWFAFLETNKDRIYDEYNEKCELDSLKKHIKEKENGLDHAAASAEPANVIDGWSIVRNEWVEDGIRFFDSDFS